MNSNDIKITSDGTRVFDDDVDGFQILRITVQVYQTMIRKTDQDGLVILVTFNLTPMPDPEPVNTDNNGILDHQTIVPIPLILGNLILILTESVINVIQLSEMTS